MKHLYLSEFGMIQCEFCGAIISSDPIAIKHACKAVSLDTERGERFTFEGKVISDINLSDGTTEIQ